MVSSVLWGTGAFKGQDAQQLLLPDRLCEICSGR